MAVTGTVWKRITYVSRDTGVSWPSRLCSKCPVCVRHKCSGSAPATIASPQPLDARAFEPLPGCRPLGCGGQTPPLWRALSLLLRGRINERPIPPSKDRRHYLQAHPAPLIFAIARLPETYPPDGLRARLRVIFTPTLPFSHSCTSPTPRSRSCNPAATP